MDGRSGKYTLTCLSRARGVVGGMRVEGSISFFDAAPVKSTIWRELTHGVSVVCNGKDVVSVSGKELEVIVYIRSERDEECEDKPRRRE